MRTKAKSPIGETTSGPVEITLTVRANQAERLMEVLQAGRNDELSERLVDDLSLQIVTALQNL